jgi:hypothetical protein
MSRETPAAFARRVSAAAEVALAEQQFVAPIDIMTGLGWIHDRHIKNWQQGRVAALEEQLPPQRLATVLELLGQWAQDHGLTPTETSYVSATRDRRELRFSASGDPATEQACRTHWMSPGLPPRPAGKDRPAPGQAAGPGGRRRDQGLVLRQLRRQW